LTNEQRSRGGKDRQPLGLSFWRVAGGVAPQSQNPLAMLLRRALPSAHQNLAHPFPIYEMGCNFVQRFEGNFTFCEIAIFERLRKE
jgi:hypothetical protein